MNQTLSKELQQASGFDRGRGGGSGKKKRKTIQVIKTDYVHQEDDVTSIPTPEVHHQQW